jgi:hypothetical protein
MSVSRSYVVDVHVPAKPSSVRLGDRSLPVFEITGQDRDARQKSRAAFEAAMEGWLYDATDRRGVLHVRIKPQSLATGFIVRMTM